MCNTQTRLSKSTIRTITLVLLLALTATASAFDHSYETFSTVLNKYVANGGVDYDGLQKDQAELLAFLKQCAGVTFEEYSEWMRQEKMCFLINLYNAGTLQLILQHYPLRSIRNAGQWWRNPWNTEFITIFGFTKGLGHIEHEVLRPSFRDSRIHFALYLAAAGSPWLRSEPYLPARLDEQLDDQERVFMRVRPESNRFENGVLHLSPLFDWYSEDFGKKQGMIALARKHFGEIPDKTKIIYTKFDWSLR